MIVCILNTPPKKNRMEPHIWERRMGVIRKWMVDGSTQVLLRAYQERIRAFPSINRGDDFW